MSEPTITTVDIDAWVNSAQSNLAEHAVRRVMRFVLMSVANSPWLKSKMVIKGGVLLALGYGTARHTKDLDFSTHRKIQEEDTGAILEELTKALAAQRARDSSILCRVQSHELKPPGPEASFPTLRIRVGYGFQGEKQYQRMVQGQPSAQVVTIDLSFNEQTCITSSIVFDGHEIAAYSLYDQVAEKYRALIQQTSDRRGRVRRQDVYDIYSILRGGHLAGSDDKATLLMTMQQKFAARNVTCERDVINEPEIAQRSHREYAQLQDEIEGVLPDFEEAFEVVRGFYLSLPWNNAGPVQHQ